jgi:DNA-binding transcriptional ArsR family regulator
MSEKQQPHLVFAALSDPTRMAILQQLQEGARPVGQIVQRFDLAGPTITRHLDALERAGLIRRTRRGQEKLCSLDPQGFLSAHGWLARFEVFRTSSLDNLAERFDKDTTP